MSSHKDTIAPALAAIVGSENVRQWEFIDQEWQQRMKAAIAPHAEMACMVSPGSVEELAEVVTCIHQQEGHIIPCGNGSKLGWGGLVGENPRSPLILVSTERINRLIDHAVGDLTVTVEAGMPFAQLQAILAKQGQFLAIDPTYPDQATLGGIVATADTGSLRQRYNSVRDMLLGISFIRADGQVVKAGGRVVKNVAGYDLMKLLTGSFGTLGLISQVTFRVYPLPEASQTVLLSGEQSQLKQAASTLLSSALTPTCMDWLSASILRDLHLGQGTGLVLRFQSIASSVQEQIRKVSELGQALNLNVTPFEAEDDLTLWQRLQDQMTPSNRETAISGKIGIRPAEAIALLQHLEQGSTPSYLQLHAASGLGKLLLPEGSPALEQLTQIRSFCQRHSGFLSILQAPVTVKQQLDVWGYTGNALDVMRSLKQQFDPKNTLSPHRFVGGI